MHDTEDKKWWVLKWSKKERLFVDVVCQKLNLNARINPLKKSDPFVPDLIVNGHLAELKCQRTPFFKAKELYGIDPQFAITFNDKDLKYYTRQYPSLEIYFWVHWQTLSKTINGTTYKVKPMHGVWRTTIKEIAKLIQHLHQYQRRTHDTRGNAKASYLLSLEDFDCLYLSTDYLSGQ